MDGRNIKGTICASQGVSDGRDGAGMILITVASCAEVTKLEVKGLYGSQPQRRVAGDHVLVTSHQASWRLSNASGVAATSTTKA